MSELRIYKKEDGTEVLQEKKCLTVPGSSFGIIISKITKDGYESKVLAGREERQ